MKAKKIAAISSALVLSSTTVLAGTPNAVFAQEKNEAIQQEESKETTSGEKTETPVKPDTTEKPAPETSVKPENTEKPAPEAPVKPEDTEKPAPEAPVKPEDTEKSAPEQEATPKAEEIKGIPIDESHFPDPAFRNYVQKRFDTENNSKGVLTQAEINKVTTIFILIEPISNTQGLEYFTELTQLSISDTDLSSFTLKGMHKLTSLTLYNNKKLESLNIDLPNLESFDCSYNHLKSIDVSNFKNLKEITYDDNPELKTLDFRGCNNLKKAHHSVNQETVYISAGMTKYIGCHLVSEHTGNIVIDLDGFYTVNPDGSKSVDLSKVISPTLINVFAKEKHPSFDATTNILTIPAGEKQTILQAGKDDHGKPTKWTFYTELTKVDDRTVKFNTMGGSIVEDQIVANGSQATEPTVPTKEGYIFKGWYLDEEFSKPYDFAASVTEDITLYAKWEQGEVTNTPPVINAEDITLTVGDTFNPLDHATATDKEDGEIKLTNDSILKNDVNTATPGTYHITYKVTDKNGASAEKTIQVTVNPKPAVINTPPVINAEDITLTVGDKFDPLNKVSATDKEDGALKLTKDNVLKNDVDTSKTGTYHVTYKVTDKDGASTEKTIQVTVKEKKINKTTKTDKTPKTADMTNIGLFSSMFAGSMGTLSILFGKKRRKK